MNVAEVHRELAQLDFNRVDYSSVESDYFSFYKLDFPEVRHHFGYFDAAGYRVAAHVFIPEKVRGTFFALHGFLDHSAYLQSVIEFLLDKGFAVACFDLPGHGLSSGERSAISNFTDYALTLEKFIELCRAELPPPYNIVGHSTGCAASLEYLYRDKRDIKQVIFAAPLVRSALWHPSRAIHGMFHGFLDYLPRFFRVNTSNSKMMEFMKKHDPLQDKKASVQWISSLYEWHDRVHCYPELDCNLLIIQGDQDSTVDWKYNIPFLQKKVTNVEVEIIRQGRHHLFNESEEHLNSVLGHIEKVLHKA